MHKELSESESNRRSLLLKSQSSFIPESRGNYFEVKMY